VKADVRRARTILAINFNHDGSAALVQDGALIGYLTTERHSRLKKHPGIRTIDLERLLDRAGLAPDDLDQVVLCNLGLMDSDDIPKLHDSDLKDSWIAFDLADDLESVTMLGTTIPCTVNPDHALLHAACAYYTSPFDEAAVLAIDPLVCELYLGSGAQLRRVDTDFSRWFDASRVYTGVSIMLFGTALVGAGKVMALAPYGRTRELEQAFHALCTARRFAPYPEMLALADRYRIDVPAGDRTVNAALAAVAQLRLEQQLPELFATAESLGRPNLCLSGGTVLNILATEAAFRASSFGEIYFHPACGDDGTALGAALWCWHKNGDQRRTYLEMPERMFCGWTYAEEAIDAAISAAADRVEIVADSNYIETAAGLLAAGHVVAWFDGDAEIGPRALGHRSLLADPRSDSMREHLNGRIKLREHFRPLAPVVREEDAGDWFDLRSSPFMLRCAKVLGDRIPAVTHVDGTARLQTVSRAVNPPLWQLLGRFGERTGVPVLVNTSLNVRGEPIVETPADAVTTFLSSDIDVLVFPGRVLTKPGPIVERRGL